MKKKYDVESIIIKPQKRVSFVVINVIKKPRMFSSYARENAFCQAKKKQKKKENSPFVSLSSCPKSRADIKK